MKAFRFKKHRMKNVKVNVLVISEDIRSTIPPGWNYDVPLPPPLHKPKLPLRLLTKIKHPQHNGRIELSF